MPYSTEKAYTGDGSTTDYSITFPFLEGDDIKAKVDSVTTTAFSVTGTTLSFDTAPANTKPILIYRDTGIDKTKVTFQVGASVRAQDLNTINKQLLYAIQEEESNTGSEFDLATGDKNHITVNSANDWTIDNNVITKSMMTANSVDSDQYVDLSIDRAHLAADVIDSSKLADDAVDSEHIGDGAINGTAMLADLVVTRPKIANDIIDSTKLADNSVGNEHMKDNAIGNAEMKDDAIGIAELSATGTASSSTWLRGDNTWSPAGQSGLLLKTAIGYGPSGSGNIYFNSSSYTTVVSATISPTAATNDMIITWAGGWQYGDEGNARLEGRILRTVGSTETEIWASDHIIYRPGVHGGQVKGLHSGMIRMDDGYDTTSNVTYSFQVKKTQGVTNCFYSDVNNHTILIQEIQA